MQLVLHADWQLERHSPQPLFLAILLSSGLAIVLKCFIISTSKLTSSILFFKMIVKTFYDFFLLTAIILATMPAGTHIAKSFARSANKN